MKLAALAIGCALCVLGWSKSEWNSDITFGNTKAGSNKATLDDQGAFVSTTDLEIGGVKMHEVIKSTFINGKFGSVTALIKHGDRTVTITLNGRDVSIFDGTKTTKATLTKAPAALFANFHPQITRAVTDLKKIGEDLKTEVFIIDAATFVSGVLSSRPSRIAKLNGTPFSADLYDLNFQGLKLEIGIDSRNGWVVGENVASQRGVMQLEGIEDLFVDPISRYPELSQPDHEVIREPYEVSLMRDGTPLRATIVRPKAPGRYPAILVRTPYGRDAMADYYGDLFAPRGYVIVCQDVRGKGGSFGEWDPFMHERLDGYDTVQWVAKQGWCDGNVGMIGSSYVGMVQWQAAVEQPPALKCIIPQVSPPDPFYNIPYDHGTFILLLNLWWTNIVAPKVSNMAVAGNVTGDLKPLATLPIGRVDESFLGQDIPFWNKWIERDTAAKWAGANYQADLDKVKIPVLMVSGWWDGDLPGTTMNWMRLRALGHEKRWLIMGPWGHAFNSTTQIADEDFGNESLLELDSVYLRFFDTYLKHKEVQFENRSRAQIFLTGSNEWRGMSDYPHKLSQERKLYLSSNKDARNASSDGTLGMTPGQGQSTISYDPEAVGRSDSGPDATLDFSFNSYWGDELYFKSDPMTGPLDISGPITVSFSFTSSAQDCDFYATLVDVDAKEQPRLIHQGGKIRASFVKGMDQRIPLVPGKINQASIWLWDVAHTFKPGHRIGLLISCNQYPFFDRNLGYADPPSSGTRMQKSTQTIFHNRSHPAALSFQVMPPLE